MRLIELHFCCMLSLNLNHPLVLVFNVPICCNMRQPIHRISHKQRLWIETKTFKMVHRSDEKRENGYFHVWECLAAVTLANNNYIYIFILEFSLCNDCFCIFSFHLFCTFFHFPKRFPLKLSVATKHRHVDCRRSGSNKIIIICLFLFFHNNVFFFFRSHC